MRFSLPTACALFAASLTAQNIDTLGGTTTAATRTATGKASVFQVDSTVLLTEYEMYLDVPAPESVTFFMHRYHSRSGTFTLEWQTTVAVNGGIGAAWYSTGPVAVPLVAGNFYLIGATWPGSLTYHYSTSQTPVPVSFGSWQRAHTLTYPLPQTYNVAAGIDIAVYNQRLTTIPVPAVVNVGTGCSATTPVPRLVASDLFTIGSTPTLDLVDAAANALAIYAIALGPTLPTPLPFLGCSIWLDLSVPTATASLVTDGSGRAILSFPLPQNQSLIGTAFATQAGVLGAATSFSNAIDIVVN